MREFGLLDAAVMRPQHSVSGEDAYPDIHHKTAALLYSLARNHPFVDGNKRTALTAGLMVYALNGWELVMPDDELVGFVVDVAEGQIDVPTIAGVLKGHARELFPDD